MNFKPSVQERMLKAFLDLIILQMLPHRSMTAAYQIDSFIMDKFHTKISPSVIYAKLATMERQGLIECHPDHGKTYGLTEEGKQLLDKKSIIIKEIRDDAITLFEN